jgi:D-alanine-D-alanine ligase
VGGEIVITGREFYDFEAKYLGAVGIDLVCPADLTPAELADLQEQSVRAFEALGAAGLARVDFFLTDTGLVLNEINTMPGFTPISMFPRCWQETGLAYSDLITELIEVALAHRGSSPVE